MCEGGKKLQEELLHKQEPGLGDLGKSQPTMTAKDAKIQIAPESVAQSMSCGVPVHPFATVLEKLKKSQRLNHKRFKVCLVDPSQSRQPQNTD